MAHMIDTVNNFIVYKIRRFATNTKSIVYMYALRLVAIVSSLQSALRIKLIRMYTLSDKYTERQYLYLSICIREVIKYGHDLH